VAVDNSNNVYVADQGNSIIRMITPAGVVTTIAGTVYTGNSFHLQDGTNSHAGFSQASGVAVDSAGNLYIADLNNSAIRKITPSGTNWITTTIAGSKTGVIGSADGTNNAALFSLPHDVAVDDSGNIFVDDLGFLGAGYTIRKITPMGTNWVVTTIAGQAGVQGTADGTNSSALFYDPESITVDNNGNLFVGDSMAIRELAPMGTNWIVTTIVGSITNFGSADGTNSAAMFSNIHGLEADNEDNIYVADLDQMVRKVTPVGTNWVVTTLAGQPGVSGTNNGAGSAAQFYHPASVAIDGFGNLYVADYSSSTIRKGYPFAVTNQPQSQGAMVGTNVLLAVSLFGDGPFLYQWLFGGAPLPDQTNATLALNSVQRTNSGLYAVVVTGADTNDIVTSSNAELRVLVTPVMVSPQISSNGTVRLQFQDADGGVPFDLDSLEVQWRTNLPSGTDTNWQSLTSGFYLTNGVVEIDDTNTIGLPNCFYRVVEH